MRRFFQSARRRLKTAATSPHFQALLLGTSAGAMLLSWCFQWTARLGSSLAVVSALSLGVLIGLELGFRPFRSRPASRTLLGMMLGSQGLLIAWTLGFGGLMTFQTELLGAFSPAQLANPALVLAVCFGSALVLIAPVVFVIAKLPFCLIAKEAQTKPHLLSKREGEGTPPVGWSAEPWIEKGVLHDSGSAGASPSRICEYIKAPDTSSTKKLISGFLGGSALGVVLSAFVFSPMCGLLTSTMLFALAGLCTTAFAFSRWSTSQENRSEEPAAIAEELPAAMEPAFWLGQGREIWSVALVICVGGLFAWTGRAVDQLMPTAVSLVCAKWASLLAGWAVGFWWNRRTSHRPSHPGLFSSFFLAAWVVFVAAAFPGIVDLCLSITAFVSNVFLLTVCRFALVLGLIAPLGVGWGRISALALQAEEPKAREAGNPPGVSLLPSAFLAGWLLGLWVLIPHGSMSFTLIGLTMSVLMLSLARLAMEQSWPKRWTFRFATAALSGLALTSFFTAKNYQPQTSAQLLFAAPVFIAHQSDVDRELLTALDEGRLLDSVEGRQGTYTLWKYRGVQYQIRQSGLPKGMASGNVVMCPDYSAEVLPAAMPLVLHERPASILILGLGSGVPLRTALAFPTQQVTCVETDPALIELVKEHILTTSQGDFPSDPRLTILPVDPALMLRSDSGKFDIIVSMPHQPTIAQTAAYFTEAFYRDAAAKLTEHGLFCQRFAYVDFGPDALRAAAKTMQAAFGDVVFLEMAGGEMLLMGTNSPQGVAREGFMDRLQKEHVRRHLGTLGWDWSIPLNLSAYNHESLRKFIDEDSSWSSEPNTSSNGTLAFRLPTEMMRWGPKPQENQQALAEHMGRFAQWGGIDPQDPDLLRRLAEVTGQRKLMVNHPDEYWVYRKVVKDQVTKRPRAVIVQVKGELPHHEIHEEEKRRLAYFRALGATLKHSPHRMEDIAQVEAFAEPYDPLVTFFLHQEVAELHSRAARRNYAAELVHRMHSVFFAAPGDRSVRNVTAAMELLCEHPEAAATPTERWDHLNALLQIMKQRWAIRAGLTPASAQVTLNDIDKSVAAVQTALGTMEDFREDAGIPAQEWEARRRFLETTVVHPLRGYRRQLLPFGQRERLMKEKQEDAATEE